MRISSEKRYYSDHGWLKSYFLFSFDQYYDPNNHHFGALRVFNDDTIAPHSGFPEHDHEQYEIVTIVLQGAVTHQDSTGTNQKVKAGEVQVMSAGTGVSHSEMNEEDEALKLYQLWLQNNKTVKANYRQQAFPQKGVVPVASGEGKGGIVLHSNATVWKVSLKPGEEHTFQGKVFFYVTSGKVRADQEYYPGDQYRAETIKIHALDDTELVAVTTDT